MKGAWIPVVLLVAGCSSANVRPVSWAPDTGRRICVKDNPAVADAALLPAIWTGLARNQISAVIIPGNRFEGGHAEVLMPPQEFPSDCDYILTYSGTMWWDLAAYLNHAEFRVQDRSYRQVGFGEYHLAGHGGFDLSKWRSTESKVGPVLDKLLTGAAGVQ